MPIRSFVVSIFILASLLYDNSSAYTIHAKSDTVIVHAMRGHTGQPGNLIVISSREGEDTATFYKQGWDTIRTSISGGSEFAWGASWETIPIPFLGDRQLYLEYSPTSLTPSMAIITVVGDSNTIQIVIIGIPDTNHTCLKITSEQTQSFPEGGSGLVTDTIFNLTDSPIVIDSVTNTPGDTGVFAIASPSFPQTIAANSSLVVSIGATIPKPAIKQEFYSSLKIWDHGTSSDGATCTTANASAVAYLLIPYDTIILELPPSASDTLNIDVHAAITGHVLLIHNSSGDTVFLENAVVNQTTNMVQYQTGYGPHCTRPYQTKAFCFDDTLAAGAFSDTARFTMQVSDSGTYPIDLTVNYIDGPETRNYIILAHYTYPANSSVSITPSTPVSEFTLNPNPARGEVTITPPEGMNSTIEIYDVLGGLVLRKQASASSTMPFVWSGESSNGEIVPEGAYIVRVIEAKASGEISAASKRLMFLR